MKKLLEFFQDGDGQLSATRLVFIGWNITVMLIVLYTLIILKQTPKVDLSVYGILATILGGKIAQNYTERSVVTPDKKETTTDAQIKSE